MRKWQVYILVLVGAALLAIALYQIPPVHQRLSWRLDFALAYLRGVVNAVEPLPTPAPTPADQLPEPDVAVDVNTNFTATATQTPTEQPSPTPGPTATPMPTATPRSASFSLEAPEWEKQDINNCGPASLSMYLRYYGWNGDQYDIAALLKPTRQDRNVNVDELVYYVRTNVGWLNAEYRVAGDLELIKELVVAGMPVLVEESFSFEGPYWPNDDLWAAHYNLITGYDDESGTFTGQDSYYGPDRKIAYQILDDYWEAFNRVYIVVYPPEQEELVRDILGEDWDVVTNRQNALKESQLASVSEPDNAFVWFNLGTNLTYFERYTEAAEAYDVARNLGLPQRMLRYQFGPFIAYFHSGRIDDLMTLAEYALQRTPNAEEALLWRGWGNYRLGNTSQALADFRQALIENSSYLDAQYALNYVNQNP